MKISDKQLLILQYLARYTYLTTPHFITLGISKHASHVTGRYLKPLIEGRFPLVEYSDYSAIEQGRTTRKPRIHTLTKRGRNILAEFLHVSPESIYYPINKIQFTRDYTHRVRTLDLLISFDQWTRSDDNQGNLIDPYFRYSGSQRKKGSQLTSVAAVSYSGGVFVPDANLLHQTEENNDLFTLELERQPKSKRIIEEKLYPHAQILAEGVLSSKYDHELGHRVLFAFESVGTMEAVASFVATNRDFSELQQHFLFAMYEDVKADFTAWKTAGDLI